MAVIQQGIFTGPYGGHRENLRVCVKDIDIDHWRKLYCLCHIFCYSVNMYIYWFICCVYVVTFGRRGSKSACIFFDFLKERSHLFHCPFISLPFLHHLWLGVSICEVFKPDIFNIFLSLSLSLSCLSSGHIDMQKFWNYQSTFPDFLRSFNAFMLRQYKGVYTNCYTRVYRVHICVHMCNTRYLSNLLLWLLIIKHCCPFESCLFGVFKLLNV